MFTPDEKPHQEDVAKALEKVRSRLLDLTNNNKFLNFKYLVSKKFLRIIDALPDIVFLKLRAFEELFFDPIPPPTQSCGSTAQFREYPGKLDLLQYEKSNAVVSTVGVADRQISAGESASSSSIETSYDLPESSQLSDKREEHQSRNFVRVLHYEDELERIFKNIIDITKTALEETGVNTLYLIFGFLEWYDDDISDVPHLAPLLLVPVKVTRYKQDVSPGSYFYSMEYTGEDIEINLTLKEKLKKFSLDLPDLAEEEIPEAYFSKLEPSLKTFPRWKIRRHLSLTNLSFHKLLIWKDLDYKNWHSDSLLGHTLLREILIGRPTDEAFSCDDYSIDLPEIQAELPPLIYDADSSQHSALIDAIRGKNLVIEGPPGAGKSQTITNLIAALLFKGKTVLFVSEKKAALDIVQLWLKKAGLDDFCLDLHDDKTKAKNLVVNLRKRLNKKNSFRFPLALGQKKLVLEENKRQLIEYVKIIHSKYGGCDQTIRQIIGVRERLRQEVRFNPDIVESILLPAAEELTILQVEKIKQCAEIYGKSLLQLSAVGAIRDHPWFGVTKQTISLDEEQAFLNALRIIANMAYWIEWQFESFRIKDDIPLHRTGLSVGELINMKDQLPVIEVGLRTDLLQPLSCHSSRLEMRYFGELLDSYRKTWDRLVHQLGKIPNIDQIEMLREACEQASRIGAASLTVEGLKQYSNYIESFANSLSQASDLFNQICRHLNCQLQFDVRSVFVLMKLLVLLDEAPLDVLYLHRSTLETNGAEQIIAQAQQEAAILGKQVAEISERLDWNFVPERELLPKHAIVCANASPFSFMVKEFRSARQDWRSMSKHGRNASSDEMAKDFRSLIQCFDNLNKFNSNPLYQEVLGELFNGLETRFDELKRLAKWSALVKEKLGFGSEAAIQASASLLSAPPSSLKALLELKKSQAVAFEQFHMAFNNFQTVVTNLPALSQIEAKGDLDNFVLYLKAMSAHLQSIAQMFDGLNIETELPLSDIPTQLDAVKQLSRLRDEIDGNRKIAIVLGRQEISAEMDFAEVTEVINFIESLEKSSLPSAIVEWLLAADIEHRSAHLRNVISQISDDYKQFQQAIDEFIAITGGNEQDWYLAGMPNSEVNFRRVRAKAERALGCISELGTWFTYLRARHALIGKLAAKVRDLTLSGKYLPAQENLA